MPETEHCLRQLCLSGVRDTLQTRVLQAQGANQPFLETFSLILQDELDCRQSRLIERRAPVAGLAGFEGGVVSEAFLALIRHAKLALTHMWNGPGCKVFL